MNDKIQDPARIMAGGMLNVPMNDQDNFDAMGSAPLQPDDVPLYDIGGDEPKSINELDRYDPGDSPDLMDEFQGRNNTAYKNYVASVLAAKSDESVAANNPPQPAVKTRQAISARTNNTPPAQVDNSDPTDDNPMYELRDTYSPGMLRNREAQAYGGDPYGRYNFTNKNSRLLNWLWENQLRRSGG